jgi:hypothetical protein
MANKLAETFYDEVSDDLANNFVNGNIETVIDFIKEDRCKLELVYIIMKTLERLRPNDRDDLQRIISNHV